MSRIQLRRGTAAEWTLIDPVLASGEVGVEIDTGSAKIGNGTDLWSVLDYLGGDLSAKADLVGGFVPDAQIPAGVTRDSELAAAVSAVDADLATLQADVDLKAAITYVDAADALLRTTVATNVQTGTTYTLVLSDAGKDVRMGNASASTLTIPPNSSEAFPTDTVIGVVQYGAGQVTITAGAGVTLRNADGPKTAKQYAAVSLKKLGTDEWLVLGGVA